MALTLSCLTKSYLRNKKAGACGAYNKLVEDLLLPEEQAEVMGSSGRFDVAAQVIGMG